MTRALSREDELLLLCARIDLGPGDGERIDDLLREGIDWTSVERRSGDLGVRPLLLRHLGAGARARLLPPETLARLREAHRLQSIRSLRLLGQAGRVLDALERQGVAAILLKGALLAETLYPDPALRPMGDIDLLCRGEDAARVGEVLEGLGFSQRRPAAKSARHERLAEELGNHLPPFADGRGTTVEVHLRLFPALPRPGEVQAALRGAAVPRPWQGRTVLGLAPEDELAYLASHLHRHLATPGPLPLYWWCDLHELVRASQRSLSWERFLARVEALDAGAGTGAVLRVLRDHWRTPVPDAVLDRLAGAAPPLSVASLLRGTGGGPELLVRSRLALLRHVAASGGALAALVFLFRVVWPSRGFIAERYGLGARRAAVPYRLHFAGRTSLRLLRTALLYAVRGAGGATSGARRGRDGR